jgi:hypothetical protein
MQMGDERLNCVRKVGGLSHLISFTDSKIVIDGQKRLFSIQIIDIDGK